MTESGIMKTDNVDRVRLLEGIVISTAQIIWVETAIDYGVFSKLISKTDCSSALNDLSNAKS